MISPNDPQAAPLIPTLETVTCSRHRKYRGRRRPTYPCLHCWELWRDQCARDTQEAVELLDMVRGELEEAIAEVERLVGEN